MSKKHLRTETGTVRRTYKDTVFRKIFNNKENLLALYNALNGTHYNNPEDIEIITLDNALFLKMKNDIAFLVSTDQTVSGGTQQYCMSQLSAEKSFVSDKRVSGNSKTTQSGYSILHTSENPNAAVHRFV
ncbi:MAG: hypothetical protein ACLSG9_11495 [Eubacterium sp.]